MNAFHVVLVAALLGLVATSVSGEEPGPVSAPAECGPGSEPETDIQGRVPRADYESGRADRPYSCNAELVASIPGPGGYKVLRYVDRGGNECAYYDTTLLFPLDLADPRRDSGGVFVVDMADPSQPRVADRLVTPAMLSPHESLVLNERRGLLAAVTGNPGAYPGIVDLYDVSEDCRSPRLLSSSPVGFMGHESGFAPDGMTLYAASLATSSIAAIDVSDPALPRLLTVLDHSSHGLTTSEDGNRAYLAALYGAGPRGNQPGLVVLDTSQIQSREPVPQVSVVSTLTWPEASIPQVAVPVTIGGVPHLVEIDEFAGHPYPVGGADPSADVGAGRLIDIADETDPRVVSNLRLEVHEREARAGESADDPRAQSPVGGYAGHYCAVPTAVEPQIAACSMIVSGLRVFDIREPGAPREVAYFNHPAAPGPYDPDQERVAPFAMSGPAFAPERNEVWYSDGASGFHVVRLTNGAWGPPGPPGAAPPRQPHAAAAPPPGPGLPATGLPWALGVTALVAGLGAALSHRRQ